MIKIDSYTDDNVFKNAKKYIQDQLKSGDYITATQLQIEFIIGFNKACRILDMLCADEIIKPTSKSRVCFVIINVNKS